MSQTRWDPHIIERNWPYKGQKHEVWEGGVHVAGWVNGGLVPSSSRGTTHTPLMHVSDWPVTIMHLIAGVDMRANAKPTMPLDGHDMWACLTAAPGAAKEGACSGQQTGREDILYNVNLICDQQPFDPEAGGKTFLSEVPAPKVGLRFGDMVLLAECYDWRTMALVGRQALFNVSADPSQANDLAEQRPATVKQLAGRLAGYGAQAVAAALGGGRPVQVTKKPWAALWDPAKEKQPNGWANSTYFCADCPDGVAPSFPIAPGSSKSRQVWSPWCTTGPGEVCPPSPPGPSPAGWGNCSDSDFCANHPICDCHCFCTVCHGKCGDGCYHKCLGQPVSGCKSGCIPQ